MALWTLLVLLSAVAVAQETFKSSQARSNEEIIMRNELTCINFEDSDCTIRGTNNVCVYNVGVFPVRYLGSMAGVFHPPYRLTIPSFWHKQFDQLTISLKFAKGAEKNTYILSTGQCGGSSIVLKSIRVSKLILKAKTISGHYGFITPATRDQTNGFINIVITFYNNPTTNVGRLRIYVGGVKLGEIATQGSLGPMLRPIIIGSTGCHYPYQTNVMTYMDDICFAETELTAAEVAAMNPIATTRATNPF